MTDISLLYEDEICAAFNKPPGVLVIPTARCPTRTLTNWINQQYCSQQFRYHPCHRLDRGTSGVILYAKGKASQKRMMQLFHRHKVSKTYVALCYGRLEQRSGEIRQSVTAIDKKRAGQSFRPAVAVTRYKVLDAKKSYSVVEVRPVTGHTNQIRIHFKEMGHPLIGDRKYAVVRRYPVKMKRLALHALQLQWQHPLSGRQIRAKAELPQEMRDFINSNP